MADISCRDRAIYGIEIIYRVEIWGRGKADICGRGRANIGGRGRADKWVRDMR